MLRNWTIYILCIVACSDAFAQNEISIYRTYVKEDDQSERLSYEYIENKKTGIYCHSIYFNWDYYAKNYFDQNHRMIADVNTFDSLSYVYDENDSAIVYSNRDGKKIMDHKLVFNKKGKEVCRIGYIYNTHEVSTLSRTTYLNDTLKIGSADFYITHLYGITDTSKTDSTYITYDGRGRIKGEYNLKDIGKLDSNLIIEYSYNDSTEIMWSYEKINNKYVLYKRSESFYDEQHYILLTLHYNLDGSLDGKTEYTYEWSKDKKYKNTKTTKEYRADGSVYKTRTFRWEVIEK